MWQIEENAVSTNLTGTVSLVSPFKGFKRGLLVSKIHLSKVRRYVRGIADLDLDFKKFSASLEGNESREVFRS